MNVVSLNFHFIFKLLAICGIWSPSDEPSLIFKIYGAILLSTQYSFSLFQIIYVCQIWGDIAAMTEASYLALTQFVVCFKSTIIWIKPQMTRKLMDFMETDIFQPTALKHETILIFQASRIKRICMIFLVQAYIACFLWGIMPLFDVSESKELPFKLWYPIPVDRTPYYEIAYAYQLIAVIVSASFFNGTDSVPLIMMMYGCAQLEIIREKIFDITSLTQTKVKVKSTIPKRAGVGKENVSARTSDDDELIYERLSDCIFHHQTLVEFLNEVENAYHLNIFFQACASVGIISIIALRIMIVDPTSVEFFSMFSYMLCMMTEIYAFCWCGNEVTFTSMNLRDAFYMTEWNKQGRRYNTTLQIAMERFKKPIVIRAGRYLQLSLQTFLGIIRTSYSYFAVLNQVRDE